MISPIVVRVEGGRWRAHCHSLRCGTGSHLVASGRTAGEAENAAMPHLKQLNTASTPSEVNP